VINPKARPCDEAAIRSVRAVPDRVASEKFWVLVATILASSIAYIDESVVNVALPVIEADLGASVAVIQWLINAYTLSLAALLLIGGTAGDHFGRRRVFVLGTGIFAAASIWCGFAENVFQLITARAVQGLGAALLIPCSLAMVGASFDKTERGKAIGTWAGFSSLAAAIGPLLGGWIVDQSQWRWIFLINPFLAIPTIWIAIRNVPESRDPEATAGLDWRGALLAFVGLGGLIFGLIAGPKTGWGTTTVIGSLLAGTLLLVAFLWEEAHSRSPMMPLHLFRSRTFSGVNLLTLLLYGALAGAFLFLPFDLIQVHGYSATLAGAAFLPFTIIMGTLSRWSGGLLDRFGARLPLALGPAIAALGFALLALPSTEGTYWTSFLAPLVTLGLGMAVTVAPLTTLVINAVPADQAGVASGINNAVATLANVLAVAIIGALAVGVYNRGLDHRLAMLTVSSEVKQAVYSARGNFVTELHPGTVHGDDLKVVESIVKESLSDSIRLVMVLAAVLALAGALCAAFAIRPENGTARP
jgi:EmrB/QacA subfamily drug resistance transporter